MWKKAVIFVLPVGLAGCVFDSVTKLQPEAKRVTLVREHDRPLDCKVLGKITGKSRAGDEKSARKGAENEFRNAAAEMKGNFAMIEAQRTSPYGTSSQTEAFVGGKALFCTTPEMEEAQEKKREKEQQIAEENERQEQAEKERKEQEAKDKKERQEQEAKDKKERQEQEAKDKKEQEKEKEKEKESKKK